jgi:hypothetical protein
MWRTETRRERDVSKERQQYRFPDCAKPQGNAYLHCGSTPQQRPPGETAGSNNRAADQNDYGQSTTRLGHGAQQRAIVVVVQNPENHRKSAKGED